MQKLGLRILRGQWEYTKGWRITRVPDETKLKIWKAAENGNLRDPWEDEGVKREKHLRDYVEDKRTIKKVLQELGRIKLQHLPYLNPDVLYYVLKRRPDLVSEFGLQADEVEMIKQFTEEDFRMARIWIPSPDEPRPDPVSVLRRLVQTASS